jgi:Protein of unknown function (DUF4058)
MASPFPGMDPYLEHPSLWPEVHTRLISAIATTLETRLSDAYFIGVEKRIYQLTADDAVLIGIPDTTIAQRSSVSDPPPILEPNSDASATTTLVKPATCLTVTLPMPVKIRESYLEIRDIETGDVITAIEVLSPANKRTGEGRRAYEFKRQAVLGSQTHLIEIDLLRSGHPMLMMGSIQATNYRILVSPSNQRPHAQLYGFNVEQPIPIVPIPLKLGEVDLDLDLQDLLTHIYSQARYARRIDYQTRPVPALPEPSQTWAIGLIQSAPSPNSTH